MSGRIVQVDPAETGAGLPVPGVDVVVYDAAETALARTVTGPDGRWALPDVAPGPHLVVAVVPHAFRPASGPDPWIQGATSWGAVLGWVVVADQPIELVDLRLRPR